jgi:RNA recognition motif-containing protein
VIIIICVYHLSLSLSGCRYSIYVGQVDYSTTPEELLSHFESCGVVERVTIVCDKITGRPKGKKQIDEGGGEMKLE